LRTALKIANERAKAEALKLRKAQNAAQKHGHVVDLTALEGKKGFRKLMNTIVGYEEDPNSSLD
jgi:hypothetical protein